MGHIPHFGENKNDRAKYLDAFYHIVNWSAVDARLEKLLGKK